MLRRLVSIYIALMAVGFAFAALAAIRWPTIMLLVGVVGEGTPDAALSAFDWREIGILYGAPYFLAAMCLYGSASLVARHRNGALSWYLLGALSGFPCVFLVDFEAGWWRDPSAGEGAVAGLAMVALLLAIAVFDLRRQKPRAPLDEEDTAAQPARHTSLADRRAPASPIPTSKAYKRHGAFPAAAARNRARFAREGRKQMVRERS